MDLHRNGHRKLFRLLRTAVFLGLAGTLGWWIWEREHDPVRGTLLLVALVALTIPWLFWRSRARAARRLHAAWDAYAEREIASTRARSHGQTAAMQLKVARGRKAYRTTALRRNQDRVDPVM
jgi:hypothetical protein